MKTTEEFKMNKDVTYYVKPYSAYGKTEYQPDCACTKIFAELLGQKRLTQKNIDVLKKLGVKFEVKGQII
jgi:hypothetical protein